MSKFDTQSVSATQNQLGKGVFRTMVLVTLMLLTIGINALQAQLTGTKNIPGDYADLALAITDLNTQGVGAGGVVLNLVAGNPQTAPAGGYTITTLTGSVANTITIQGNTNTITASSALTAGSLTDAIFKIIGTDFVTIQGFNMQENVLNTVTAAATNNMTEWGVALLYTTVTDNAQNCTIRNNTITLNRTYQNTFGIYANATHTATAISTSATGTGAGGGNSGLKIYGNTVSNVNLGIVVVGPTAAADANNSVDVGGTGGVQANTVTNFGTTGTFSSYVNVSGTVNGILVRNSININISFNTITSSVGGTIAGTLNGIQVPTSSSTPTGTFTNTINNNNISLQSAVAAGAINGITYPSGSASTTSTLNVNNNNFQTFGHTIAASGTIIFISVASTNQFTNINSNTFTNISVNTTGSVTFISQSFTAPATGTKTTNNNAIVTAFNKTGAGGTVTFIIDNGSTVTGAISTCQNNNFSNGTLTGATGITGISYTDGGTAPTRIVTGNIINNWTTGAGTVNAMNFTYWNGVSSLSNNTVTNISGQSGITGITIGSTINTATSVTISSNTINNLSSTGTGGAVIGISCSNTSSLVNITNNTINTLSSTGAVAVSGISVSGATNTNVFKNKIYDLSGSNASSTVNGILISAGTLVNAYNNLIGDLRTPAANAANPLNGINVTGGTTVNLSYNTVQLNATSSGALFGSSAVNASTTPTLTLRNNVFVNLSTAVGAPAFTAAYRRSTTTLTSYAAASNNNLFFAGTPSATNLIFFDGTNSDQTLGAYKTRVAPRDALSVTENPTFLSTTGSSANFLHIDPTVATQIESGATNIAGITDDYDGITRQGNPGYAGTGSAPDMGADEGNFVLLDILPPSITYALIPAICSAADIPLNGVAISDASGVPVAGALVPRIYYKKNAGAWFSQAGTLATGTGTNGTWNFTIVVADMGGIVAGDVVSYYVIAQDIAAPINIASNPAGVVATDVNTVTTPPGTPNTATFVVPLANTYTVGPTGTYASVTAAVSAVLTNGLTAPVIFELQSTYTSAGETFPIVLGTTNACGSGLTATNTVTIRPETGATNLSINGTNVGPTFNINTGNWWRIDGRPGGVGTAKELSITNNNVAGQAIQFINEGSNNQQLGYQRHLDFGITKCPLLNIK